MNKHYSFTEIFGAWFSIRLIDSLSLSLEAWANLWRVTYCPRSGDVFGDEEKTSIFWSQLTGHRDIYANTPWQAFPVEDDYPF